MTGKLKFIHLSDLHLVPPPQLVRGVDPCARLEAAVSCICDEFSDVELCMVTGDMTDAGDAGSYEQARRILDKLPCRWYPLMGNHDTQNARKVLTNLQWQADGSLQYWVDTSVGRFVVLDTSVGGNVDSGRLDPGRLAYLRSQLKQARDRGEDVFLFMHHPPVNIGIGWLDAMNLENSEELWAVLSGFDNVRHMFFGHIHRPTHGTWHGIPFSTVRATAHQVKLRLGDAPAEFIMEEPSFAVVLVDRDQVLIHEHMFLSTAQGRSPASTDNLTPK